ncbi:MAG TPA: carbohydrate ABC transporter permease [Fimbriimonas sp.]|nr:carbohydrate ABC transporter permease [Fimbriimonas sp.]
MKKSLVVTFITHVALVTLSLLFIFPFMWMLSTAVKPIDETLRQPPVWIPSEIQFNNFWDAMKYGAETLGYIPFLVYTRNTILLCIMVVCGSVVSNSIVAYAFSRLEWKGRDTLFSLTISTMMIPYPVLMVPTFALFRQFEWIGTYRPLWIPAWFGSAFSIFLLRTFFKGIPFELSEAAKIDGASEWYIFRHIVLPLSKPALAVVALFSFMATWNDFLGPLIYLLDQKTFTLALGLQMFQSQHGGTQWNLLMAATSIAVIPILILFFFCQRFFIKGISITGLK